MKQKSWSAVQKTGQRMAPDEAGIELHLPQLIRITSRTKVRHTRDFVVVTVPLTALLRKRWRSFSCGKRRSHEHSLSTTVSGTDELVGVEGSRHRVDQELFAHPRNPSHHDPTDDSSAHLNHRLTKAGMVGFTQGCLTGISRFAGCWRMDTVP